MRAYNFSAGPATLPVEVLQQAQYEMLEYQNAGMSVLEMDHRSTIYCEIMRDAQAAIRRVLGVPEEYSILFLQGGATIQFAQVPLNLMRSARADYLITGEYAQMAQREADKFGDARIVATGEASGFRSIPETVRAMFDPSADYLHITTNNTVYGTSLRNNMPNPGDVPLVADMSSDLLSEPVDVSQYDLIYAGAQQNLGCAGMTLIIVKSKLIQKELPTSVPTIFSYKRIAEHNSMYATPPTYAIYICKLVAEQLEREGGLEAMRDQNEYKAAMLYDVIDNSSLYQAFAHKEARSITNIVFTLPDEAYTERFLHIARQCGLIGLMGHPKLGGIRASIYNAMPVEGVAALAAFMKQFESENKHA